MSDNSSKFFIAIGIAVLMVTLFSVGVVLSWNAYLIAVDPDTIYYDGVLWSGLPGFFFLVVSVVGVGVSWDVYQESKKEKLNKKEKLDKLIVEADKLKKERERLDEDDIRLDEEADKLKEEREGLDEDEWNKRIEELKVFLEEIAEGNYEWNKRNDEYKKRKEEYENNLKKDEFDNLFYSYMALAFALWGLVAVWNGFFQSGWGLWTINLIIIYFLYNKSEKGLFQIEAKKSDKFNAAVLRINAFFNGWVAINVAIYGFGSFEQGSLNSAYFVNFILYSLIFLVNFWGISQYKKMLKINPWSKELWG